VDGQVDRIGIVIILALQDVNVMMVLFVITWVTVSKKPPVPTHSVR